MIENSKADEIIVSVRQLLKSFKIRPYNEDTGYGLLRHVLIRTGYATGQIMVVLVLASPVFPSKNNFVKALLKLHPEITTIVLNVNNRSTSMVLGDKEQVIYGKGFIEDKLCEKTFRISPKSFYQVNPMQAEKLYQKAIEYACLTGKETVVDAYCGTGTIGIAATSGANKVIGVELNPDAVRDAVFNAKFNKVKNIEFYQNDAGKFLTGLAKQNVHVDVVIMDPPRSGSTEEFLTSVVEVGADRVVYVSCNPDTMVRDLKFLKGKGYGVRKCVAVDMFPFTEHVETVVLLSDKKVDGYVNIDLDVEKLEGKLGTATYAEIKAYVEEKYGLKVSSLYIGQIKNKMGLEKRKNYNIGSGEGRVPTCPAEKEEAIVEAFKHFNLI